MKGQHAIYFRRGFDKFALEIRRNVMPIERTYARPHEPSPNQIGCTRSAPTLLRRADTEASWRIMSSVSLIKGSCAYGSCEQHTGRGQKLDKIPEHKVAAAHRWCVETFMDIC